MKKEVIFSQSDGTSMGVEVTIKGNAENSTELRKKAIEFLISTFDLKHDFNSEHEKFNQFTEEILLATTDLIGYESYYWDHLAESETSYNEYEELIVSKKGKIEFLEMLVKDMKRRY